MPPRIRDITGQISEARLREIIRAELRQEVRRLQEADGSVIADVSQNSDDIDDLQAVEYLTLSTDAITSNERVFTPGDGLEGTDAGAGSTYTLAIDLAATNPGLQFTTGDLAVLVQSPVTVDGSGIGLDETAVDHDNLLNFVANEHIDHTSVTLTAGDGLSGGGDISANRSFALDIASLSEDASPSFGSDWLVIENNAGGTLSKAQIQNMPYAPNGAQFVVTAASVDLTGERVLTAGTNIDIAQAAGPPATVTISVDHELDNGNYSPTSTNHVNITGTPSHFALYIAVGNHAIVGGFSSLEVTASGAARFDIPVPISSGNFAFSSRATGVVTRGRLGTTDLEAHIIAVTSSNTVQVRWTAASGGATVVQWQFIYEIP